MDILERIAWNLLGPLAAAFFGVLLASRQTHYFALRRDEWSAGRRLRTLLNAILEKHRYSCKRPGSGPMEFFCFANAPVDGGHPLVDQLDDAVNEIKDLLGASDQDRFETTWNQVRHEVRRMRTRITSPTDTAKRDMELCFNEVKPLLSQLKSTTLKLRETPWYRQMFSTSKI